MSDEEGNKKCSYFCPKPSKLGEKKRGKEELCHCGDSAANHVPTVVDPPSSGKWSKKCIVPVACEQFHGDIYFPLLDAADNRARCIRFDATSLTEDLIRFITEEWKLLKPHRPKLCISLLTAPYRKRIAEDTKTRIVSEIVQTLKTCDAWLINNGLQENFNLLIGKALSEVFTDYFGTDVPFIPPTTIGFCKWGSVEDRYSLLPFSEEPPTVYHCKKGNADGTTCALLPFNSHILFIDDGYRRNYKTFDDISIRSNFEGLINCGTNDGGLGVPVVNLVIGGDQGTIKSVLHALGYGISIIVFKGSGYAADLIAHAYDLRANYKDKPFEDFATNEKEILQTAAQNLLQVKKTFDIVGELAQIVYDRSLIAIFDVHESEDLLTKIMNLVMYEATDVVGRLYLSQTWQNIHIAEDLIVKNHAAIQTKELYGLMLTALLNEQLDFVKLFLRMGLNLQDFLTADRLHSLYNFSRNRDHLTANLLNADLDREYFYALVKDPEVALTVSIKDYESKGGGIDSLRTAFIAFLGELVDKKVQTFVDTLRVEEEERLKVLNNKTVFLSTIAEFLGYDFESTIYKHDTPHLTIWAVMHGRQEMALHFLSMSSHPVSLAIFAAGICRKIARKTPSYDTRNKEQNIANASNFEDVALYILDKCEDTDSDTTTAMLIEYTPNWEKRSLPIIAANSDCLRFVSSNAFQNMVTAMWENGVLFSFSQILLIICCPLLLCFSCIRISPPLDTLLFRVRKSIKSEFIARNSESTDECEVGIHLDAFAEDLDKLDTIPIKTKFRIFYNSPRVKYAFFLLATIAYLLFFSYMLLSDLHVNYISWSEIIVMIYSIGWFVYDLVLLLTDQEQQLWMVIQTFPWLPASFVSDSLFFVAAFCRIGMASTFIIARHAYGLQLIFNYSKLFYLMMLSQYYGPKVVMISEMLRQLMGAVSILFIIMLGYGAAVQVLLYPTLDTYNWDQVIGIFYYPYFQLFGEMSFDYFNAEKPCNATVELCPRKSFVVPFLHAAYMLIAVLIFLNLLIAVFSKIFSDLNEQSREIWMVNRFRIVFCFDRASFLPMPFAAAFVYLPKLIQSFFTFLYNRCRRTDNEPLYDSDNVWDKLLSLSENRELGIAAYLHRFQEFCAQCYYKEEEKNRVKCSDNLLIALNSRLQRLEEQHNEIEEYFQAAISARETGDASGVLEFAESSWPRRLLSVKKGIKHTTKRISKVLGTLSQLEDGLTASS